VLTEEYADAVERLTGHHRRRETQAWLTTDRVQLSDRAQPPAIRAQPPTARLKPPPRSSILPVAIAVPADGPERDLEMGRLRDDLHRLTAEVKAARAETQAERRQAQSTVVPRRAAPPQVQAYNDACGNALTFALLVAAVVLCSIFAANTCSDHYTLRVEKCGPCAGMCGSFEDLNEDCISPPEESEEEESVCLRPTRGHSQYTDKRTGKLAWHGPDGVGHWGRLPDEYITAEEDTCNGEAGRIAASVGLAAILVIMVVLVIIICAVIAAGGGGIVLFLLNGTLVILSFGRIKWWQIDCGPWIWCTPPPPQ
jgi:hypothetical protein